MNSETLQDFLAEVIALELQQANAGEDLEVRFAMRSSTGDTGADVASRAREIAETLATEAMQSGLNLSRRTIESTPLGGGNTAEVVAHLTLHAPFVFKLDSKKKKLAEEAQAMRQIKNNQKYPERFRAAWPTIYAIREIPPYAYLMEYFPKEDGWSSLEDRLYPRDAVNNPASPDPQDLIVVVLDMLFDGFAGSVDRRSRPNLVQDYVLRIAERLNEAAKLDKRFEPQAISVQGRRLRSWTHYLSILERHVNYLDEITPPFRTVAHGDPNPGNLMLQIDQQGRELKFIDPKEWVLGDYLFDIAKLTHFLEVTGPVEKPIDAGSVKSSVVEGSDGYSLNYEFVRPIWTTALINECRLRTERFAKANGDPHWIARYELGMAANLLGLPAGRLTHPSNPRPEAALIYYGEGLKWLDRFCSRIERDGRPSAVLYTAPDEVFPEVLRSKMEYVLSQVPGPRESQDRRGFRLIHWGPKRGNKADKPYELSLEHEARLIPATEVALERLLNDLHSSIGRSLGQALDGNKSRFSSLRINRYSRETGAQSVDQYYELDGSAQTGLISRNMSMRARVRGSAFMTWNTAEDHAKPICLELPFVAVGTKGLTARLEFNWIDDITLSIEEARSERSPSMEDIPGPLLLAARIEGLTIAGLRPIIEHTNFREKFSFTSEQGEEQYVLNVDRVVAQHLTSGRMGNYVDIDISATNSVDATQLAALADFSELLANTYDLMPNPGTKVWRDASVLGLLAL